MKRMAKHHWLGLVCAFLLVAPNRPAYSGQPAQAPPSAEAIAQAISSIAYRLRTDARLTRHLQTRIEADLRRLGEGERPYFSDPLISADEVRVAYRSFLDDIGQIAFLRERARWLQSELDNAEQPGPLASDLDLVSEELDDLSLSVAETGLRSGLLEFVTGDGIRGPGRSGVYLNRLSDAAAWRPALLPWPPPRASALHVLPRHLAAGRSAAVPRLQDVDHRLRTALRRAGYDDAGYFGVPRGFALVTRAERRADDGTPHNEGRWSTSVPPMRTLSLTRYLSSLGDPGRFRVLVFVVTDQPFAAGSPEIGLETLSTWANAGLNLLPPEVGREAFSERHSVTVLVYDFVKPRGAREGRLLVISDLTGAEHLRAGRILAALEDMR